MWKPRRHIWHDSCVSFDRAQPLLIPTNAQFNSYLSTINETSDVAPFNRSAYYYSSQVEVRELSERHRSWLWVRWCENKRCSDMSAFDRPCDMLFPAQENLSHILRINFVRINVVFCALIYWTTLPVVHTASDDRLGWTPKTTTHHRYHRRNI